MDGFLKLIRLPNLLIIALTLYLIRYGVVLPFVKSYGFSLHLSSVDFFLVVLSTIMIAAAGYCINDYIDIKIDRINKPQKMVVGKTVKRRVAMLAHWLLSGSAVLIALILLVKSRIISLLFLHITTSIILLFYSFWYKRSFLIGNIIISFLSALIPILAGYYDISPITSEIRFWDFIQNRHIFFLFAYGFFAFFTTLNREIIKDIEDYEGDLAYGSNTLPIKLGISKTKKITAFLTLLIVLILASVQYKELLLSNYILVVYLLVSVQLPLLLIIHKTFFSKVKTDFSKISYLLKLVMFSGILSTIVVYYTIK